MGSVRLVRSWVASPALQEMDIFAWLAGMDSSSTMANAFAGGLKTKGLIRRASAGIATSRVVLLVSAIRPTLATDA